MRMLIVPEYVLLDGVIEASGGGESFQHAGWTFRIDRGEEGDEFKLQEIRETAALLFGRKTYEGMAAVSPHMSGEMADLWNSSMPKHVVSSTLSDPDWANTTAMEGDVAEEVRRLVAGTEGNVVVHGSISLVNELLEHELVDELSLMTFPVVLGSGRQLLAASDEPSRWKSEEVRPVGDGSVISTHRPLFSYQVSTELPADVGAVWEAWTDADMYAEWFDAIPGSVDLDVGPGGQWSLSIAGSDGVEAETMSGVYEEVVPGAKLVMTTHFSEGNTVMEIVFEPVGETTRTTISRSSLSRAESDGGRKGSRILLQSCADYLERPGAT